MFTSKITRSFKLYGWCSRIRGIESGVTLRWVIEVWQLYSDTIFRSFLIAIATLGVTFVIARGCIEGVGCCGSSC